MASTMQIITKDFLENALKQHFKIDVEVFKFTMSALSDHGHCSDLFRIFITYSIDDSLKMHTMSIISKCLPEDKATADFVTGLKCFENELGFYSEILPALNNLVYRQKVAPATIYISYEPSSILLLQDLTMLNYKMHEREFGLDLDHCLLVVEKLAYFHASTAALYDQNQQMIEKYNQGVFDNTQTEAKFTSACYSSLIEVCENTPVLHSYVTKLKLLQNSVVEKVVACNEPSGKFNVLNHGDAWINNLMFTYGQNGKPDHVTFIDFQFPLFSSPVLDLHYFWAISASLQVKQQHLETIRNHYFNKLLNYLSKLSVSVPPPTRHEFDEDFRSRAAYGLAATFICTPFMRRSGSYHVSLIDYFDNEDNKGCRYECFHREAYVEELTHMLPFYDSLGVFD